MWEAWYAKERARYACVAVHTVSSGTVGRVAVSPDGTAVAYTMSDGLYLPLVGSARPRAGRYLVRVV